ncbi:MAG: cysteine hydrolase [Acetobacteraceae bacterium]|nr:cysteine hydrolase [Acetobacteraceae bacterium]
MIDMLRDFVEEGGALYCGEASRGIVPEVARLIREARARGDLVVYICDRHRPDDAEFQMFRPHCLAGSRGAEVAEGLEPQPGDVVVPKRRYSGFFSTDLDLTLCEADVDKLRLCGVCTNICVLYTAADARMRNYEVEVVRQAVASFDSEAHEFALKELERTLGAKVV